MGLFRPNIDKLKAKEDIKGLIKALNDSEANVRWEAAEALGKIGDQRAIEPLINALNDSDRYVVRERAVEALGKIGDLAVEPLINALNDSEVDVQWEAAEALVKIGDPAVEPLINTLNDSEAYVRKRAVEALGKIGDQRAVKPLSKALNDSDWLVRKRAGEALGEIGDPRAVDALSELMHDENDHVRSAARDGLRKIKSSDAYKPYKIEQAKRYEYVLRYEEAAKIYEEFGMDEDARRVRELARKPKVEVKIGDLELLKGKIEEITESKVEVEKLKKNVKTLESSKIMVEMVEMSHLKTARTEYFLDKLKLLEGYTEGLSGRLTKEINRFRRFLEQELFDYGDEEHKVDVRRFCRNLLDIWIAEVLR